MCGIAGLYDYNGVFSPNRRTESVLAIRDGLSHRGPDARGLWQHHASGCVFGHTRLAVIDLDSRSNQPMMSTNGRYCLTFNGEIYNFRHLRKELASLGHIFKTESDTEVICEGFSRWEHRLFEKLDGMFAIAIFDLATRKIHLVRDRTGEKPLFLSQSSGCLAFSSELKPLLSLQHISRNINIDSLFDYLTLRYVPDPFTIFSEVQSLTPGVIATINHVGQYSEQNYYSFDITSPAARDRINIDDYISRVEQSLIDAVETRLIADVPVGAFLSSGMDSSLVCAIAAKKTNIQSFSAGFMGSGENETVAARSIAEYLGIDFTEYILDPSEIAAQLEAFGGFLDEPNGDRSCVPTYFLAREIRKKVTVAISGDGGDELFGGYTRYADAGSKAVFAGDEISAICNYFSQRLPVFPLKTLSEMMPQQFESFRRRFAHRFVPLYARDHLSDLDRMRTVDFHSYLPGAVLAKVDRMSMRHALEVRTPFFTPSILDSSSQLPPKLGTDGKYFKIALQKILAHHLPPNLISDKKQGFGMPASFINSHIALFQRLAEKADVLLSHWDYFIDQPDIFVKIKGMARSNINSYWAWIVLGLWSETLPPRARMSGH